MIDFEKYPSACSRLKSLFNEVCLAAIYRPFYPEKLNVFRDCIKEKINEAVRLDYSDTLHFYKWIELADPTVLLIDFYSSVLEIADPLKSNEALAKQTIEEKYQTFEQFYFRFLSLKIEKDLGVISEKDSITLDVLQTNYDPDFFIEKKRKEEWRNKPRRSQGNDGSEVYYRIYGGWKDVYETHRFEMTLVENFCFRALPDGIMAHISVRHHKKDVIASASVVVPLVSYKDFDDRLRSFGSWSLVEYTYRPDEKFLHETRAQWFRQKNGASVTVFIVFELIENVPTVSMCVAPGLMFAEDLDNELLSRKAVGSFIVKD